MKKEVIHLFYNAKTDILRIVQSNGDVFQIGYEGQLVKSHHSMPTFEEAFNSVKSINTPGFLGTNEYLGEL